MFPKTRNLSRLIWEYPKIGISRVIAVSRSLCSVAMYGRPLTDQQKGSPGNNSLQQHRQQTCNRDCPGNLSQNHSDQEHPKSEKTCHCGLCTDFCWHRLQIIKYPFSLCQSCKQPDPGRLPQGLQQAYFESLCCVLSVGTKLSRDRLPHLLTLSFCSSAATVLDSELLGS